MAASGVTSKTFMWGIMGLLILALGGFGATSFTGSITRVGAVGDADIDVESYARALQEDIRAFEAQAGTSLPFDQVELFGVPQNTLSRLVNQAALDDTAEKMGLSIGDENLSRQILEMSSFAGADGSFDREAYRFMLERNGFSETDFEDQLRADTIRGLVQGAIVTGTEMPADYTDLVLGYAGERRDFTWARLEAEDLADTLPAPTDADLVAYHEENAAVFTAPATKQLTYVWLSPDDLLSEIAEDDAKIAELYQDRIAEYVIAERRLVERLSFPDAAAAAAAKASIDAGDTTFEAVVEARGLALQDIDLGDVTEQSLSAAGAAVFAADLDAVVGPLDTDLGPALFRVNGVLAGQETTLEDVRDELHAELASDAARRQIDARSEDIEDLLAGGATLEELQSEAGMTLSTIDWFGDATDAINGYAEFQSAAASVTEGDYPAVIRLSDGGLAALRYEGTTEPALIPLADIRDDVVAAWTAKATAEALAKQAATLVQDIVTGGDLAQAGLTAREEIDVMRSDYIADATPDFLTAIFAMETGDVTVIAEDDLVAVVRLDAINGPDLDNTDVAAFKDRLTDQANADLAQDLYAVFSQSLQNDAGLMLDQTAINAVHANFR